MGFTNGCFDILHSGHVALLRAARSECDRLIVALNTDASVARLKGPTRPINRLQDRATVIAALRDVDAVVQFSDDTPLRLIEAIRPDVLVKGDEYGLERIVGADLVASWGGRVVRVGMEAGRSTTNVIRSIAERDRDRL